MPLRTSPLLSFLIFGAFTLLSTVGCSNGGAGTPESLRALLAQQTLEAGTSTTVGCFRVRGASDVAVTNVLIKSFPAEGVQILGNIVTAQKSGSFELSCIYDDGTPSSPISDLLTVYAAAPVSTSLTMTPEVVGAGQYAEALCQAKDSFGNIVPADATNFALIVTDESLHVEGQYIHGTISGDYSATCDLLTQESEERELGFLTIIPGVPNKLELTTSPSSITFGPDESAVIEAKAWDAYGNQIENISLAPMTITPDNGGVTIKNNETLEFHTQGIYTLHAEVLDAPETKTTHQIIVDADGPILSVSTPEQAARLSGEQLVVKGNVSDDLALITEFVVNGNTVEIAEDGSFEAEILLVPGINAINVEAVNAHGLKSRETRWVTLAESYEPLTLGVFDNAILPSGTQVRMGSEIIDDGDHDLEAPNDLATLLEQSLLTLGLEDTLGGLTYDLYSSGDDEGFGINYALALQSIENGSPNVSLSPSNGHLILTLTYNDLMMDGLVEGTCLVGGFLDICPDIGLVSINAEQVILTAWVVPTVNTESQTIGFDVLMTTIDLGAMTMDWAEALTEQMSEIEPLINSEMAVLLEGFLSNQVLNKLPEALNGVLNAWNINHEFNIPGLLSTSNMNILLEGNLAEISVDPKGMTLHLETQVQESIIKPTDSLGAIGDLGCPEDTNDLEAPLMLGLADSVMNRFLHLLWAGELLDLETLIPANNHSVGFCGFGTLTTLLLADPGSARVSVEPMLAPVANGCVLNDEERDFRIQLGAFAINYNYRKAGQMKSITFNLGMDASFIPSNLDALALNLDSPTNVLVDVVETSGLTVSERRNIVNALEGTGAQNLVNGLNQCLGNALAFAPILDAAEMVPNNDKITLKPDFNSFEHRQSTLWFQGTLK